MTKLKSAFLSLGARGTVGGVVTVQERQRYTFIRKKPIPAYRQTDLQLNRRQTFRNWAYIWRNLDAATRRPYITEGSRHHLTGLQEFMRQWLHMALPIVGWWPLDETAGATAYDLSPFENHAVITGASPTTGLVDGAFYFDGLNDYLNCGNDPSLGVTTAYTFMCLFKTEAADTGLLISRNTVGIPAGLDGEYNLRPTGFTALHGGAAKGFGWLPALNDNLWHHVAITWDGEIILGYVNGVFNNSVATTGAFDAATALNTEIGRRNIPASPRYFQGIIDEPWIGDRALTAAEVALWAARRDTL